MLSRGAHKWLAALVALLAVLLSLGVSKIAARTVEDSNAADGFFIYLPLVRTPLGLTNGNFEFGPVSWGRYSSNGWPLIVSANILPVRPHSGAWAVWMGGDDNEDAVIWQLVRIPAKNATLRYWLWIASLDACGYDVAGIVINLDEVVDAFWLCSGNNTGGWIPRTVDLGPYAGQTVELDFAAFTDELLNSNLFIDDVSFGSVMAYTEEGSFGQNPASDIVAHQEKTELVQITPYQPGNSLRNPLLENLSFEIRNSLHQP